MNHNFIWLTKKMAGCLILVTVLSASVSTASSQMVTYQDTSSMLSKYLRKSDTATMVQPYLRKSDTAHMLGRYLKLQQKGSLLQQTGKIFISDSIRTTGFIRGAGLAVYGGGTSSSLVATTNSTTGSAGYFQATTGRALNVINISNELNNPTIYLLNKGTGDLIKAHNNAMEIMSLNNKGALKAKSFLSDTIRSVSSNGGALFANSGLKVMDWGVGSVNQAIFYGTTGYHKNTTSNYTARSFTDKNYVDSSVALRLVKSDTLNMLIPYLRKSDTALMLSGYARLGNIGNSNTKLNVSDTSTMLSAYLRKLDTTQLLAGYANKGELNNRMRYVDTASMLAGYARLGNSNTKLNISDTSTMLSAYLRKLDTTQLLAGYANKGELNNRMRYVDTASMLSVYAKRSELPLVADHLKYTDTVGMLAGYARLGNIGNSNTKLNISDTSAMLSAYLRKLDTTQLLAGYANKGELNNRMRYVDTASMLSVYAKRSELPLVADHLKYTDTVGMLAGYARAVAVQQKMNYTDTSSMLASYLKRSVGDQLYASTGVVQMKLNFSDTSSMLSPYLLKTDAVSNYISFAQLQNYLPLAGGTLNGTLYGTEARFSGNLYVKKLVVAPTTWSDYVFDKSYKLRSLKEVAQFIQENHHLPDVPSAKEVVDKGISVGENQAVLLRKIEELTLYIIEQNKRIEKLEGKIRNKK